MFSKGCVKLSRKVFRPSKFLFLRYYFSIERERALYCITLLLLSLNSPRPTKARSVCIISQCLFFSNGPFSHRISLFVPFIFVLLNGGSIQQSRMKNIFDVHTSIGKWKTGGTSTTPPLPSKRQDDWKIYLLTVLHSLIRAIKGTQAWDNFEFFFYLNQFLICPS